MIGAIVVLIKGDKITVNDYLTNVIKICSLIITIYVCNFVTFILPEAELLNKTRNKALMKPAF